MSIRETLISAAEAADIRARVDAFEAWRGNRSSYHPSEVPAGVPIVENADKGKLEQFEVWRDTPAALFAYVKFTDYSGNVRQGKPQAHDKACVTVWTGDPLGYGHCGRVWRSNMGDTRASVSVTIAGETYSGTAFVSAGDYCRLRKVGGKARK
jgi:hypothetical protein